jgi:hypothetical protein
MESPVCTLCRKPKGTLTCGSCQSAVCKSCSQTLRAGSFAFLENVPADLTHRTYCGACYDEKVAPALDSYVQAVERAKDVIVYLKNQGEETRLIKRSEKALRVVDCADRNETLLRLAFLAAQANFNALVDVDISSRKVRNEGYQTTTWNGAGVPIRLDADTLKKMKWTAPVFNVGIR